MRAAELGMPALAVTDHEGLYGAVRFYQACKAAGIKPIVGVELTVEPAVGPGGRVWEPGADDGSTRRRCAGRRRSRRRRRRSPTPPAPASAAALAPDGRIAHLKAAATVPPSAARASGVGGYHLVLLARDYAGWSNLCRIISAAHLEHPGEPPVARLATLAEHGGHLVALSGCRRGEVWSRLLAGDKAGARAAASVFHAHLRPRLLHRAAARAAAGFRRLAARPRPPRPRAAHPHRRHRRRPLHGQGRRRPPRRARRRGRQPAAAQPAGTQERRALPQKPRADAPSVPALPRGLRQRGAHRRALQPRPRPRQAPLPRLSAAAGRDRLLAALEALLRGRRRALPAAHRRGHGAARARAQGHRGARLRRVLPRRARHRRVRTRPRHLLLRPRLRRQQHRQLRAAHHRRRPHRPRAALRALPQPGAPRDAGRGHRLLLGAPRRGHPVHLRALRPRQGRHGRHRQHRPRAVGGAHRQPRLRVHAGGDQPLSRKRALGQRRQARGDARRAPRAAQPRVPAPALPPPGRRRRAAVGVPRPPRHAPGRASSSRATGSPTACRCSGRPRAWWSPSSTRTTSRRWASSRWTSSRSRRTRAIARPCAASRRAPASRCDPGELPRDDPEVYELISVGAHRRAVPARELGAAQPRHAGCRSATSRTSSRPSPSSARGRCRPR